jgi:hypothetical protein
MGGNTQIKAEQRAAFPFVMNTACTLYRSQAMECTCYVKGGEVVMCPKCLTEEIEQRDAALGEPGGKGILSSEELQEIQAQYSSWLENWGK